MTLESVSVEKCRLLEQRYHPAISLLLLFVLLQKPLYGLFKKVIDGTVKNLKV